MFKPQGYPSLSPYLIVNDARLCIDFVKAVFGVEPIYLQKTPQGRIAHVEIRIDDSVLMVGEMAGAEGGAHIHLYVADVDAVFAKAVAAGCTVVQEPVRKEDADRRGGVADLAGTIWWFATQIGEPDPLRAL